MNILKKFAAAFIAAGILVTLSACEQSSSGASTLKGDGNIVSNEWELSGGPYKVIIEDIDMEFEELTSSNSAVLIIKEDGSGKLTFATDENIADTVTVSTEGDTIRIKGDKTQKYQFTSFDINIEAAVNDLQINSAFNADINLPSINAFNVVANGVFDAEMKFGELDTFKFVCNGAGNVNISGSADEASYELNGAGTVHAFDFHTVTSSVSISGASNAQVYASDTLNADISGVGSITYDGSPVNVNENAAGLGTIEARAN